jgi:hypothetical protein
VSRWLRAAAALAIGCANQSPAPGQTWPEHAAVQARRTGWFTDPRITESSGAVRGRVNPGVFWTINDSGNEPLVFAVDTSGATRAVVRLVDGTNIDWEAISEGPCDSLRCLYVADIGDNNAVRASVRIYRFPEPSLGTDTVVSIRPTFLDCVYPDGAHDAEALVVGPGASGAIISKGREGWIGVYLVPKAAWTTGGCSLEAAGRLPIPAGFLAGRLVTDAALSTPNDLLAVRTYRDLYIFSRTVEDSADWLPRRPVHSCPLTGLGSIGEGLAFWDDSTFLLTTEGADRSSTIALVGCPVR